MTSSILPIDWFHRNYSVKRIREIAGQEAPVSLIPLGSQRSKDGPLVEITDMSGRSWTLMCGAGPLTGVQDVLVATPNPDCLLVVSGGQGYWVPATEPSRYQAVAAIPIVQVTKASKDLLLLSTFTTVVALGAEGRVWESARVSLDGFSIISIDATTRSLLGKGFNPHVSSDGFFRLSLDAGIVTLLREGEEGLDQGERPAEALAGAALFVH